MPVAKVSLDEIRSAITKATDKAGSADRSDKDQRVLESQINAAKTTLKSSETGVTRAQMTKQEAQDKLSPPPTKEVQGDGKKGGMKTVVDEREKDKLESNVRAADVQIQQAQAAVETAKEQVDKLTTQSTGSGGLTDGQQREMEQTTTMVDELKRLVNNAQTNVDGDDFQTKLKTTVDKINELGTSLPNAANPDLKEFWKHTKDTMKEVQDKYVERTNPPAYTLNADNNFQSFFTDFGQTVDKVVNSLKAKNLLDPSAEQQIRTAESNISNNAGIYLEGLDANQRGQMTGLMNLLNTVDNNLNRDRPVTAQNINDIVSQSQTLGNTLKTGGSARNTLLSGYFNGASANFDNIHDRLPADAPQKDALQELQTKFAAIAGTVSSRFTIDKPLTAQDGQALLSFILTQLNPANQKINRGEALTQEELNNLISAGNNIAAGIEEHYQSAAPTQSSGGGFQVGDTVTTGGGRAGGGGVIGGGARSRAGIGGR